MNIRCPQHCCLQFKVFALMLCLSTALVAQEDSRLRPRSGGFTFKRGEPGGFMDRLSKIDVGLNIWTLGVSYPKNADPIAVAKVRDCFDQRRKTHAENHRPMLVILRAENLDLGGRHVQPQILDELFGKLPEVLPDDKQRDKLLAEYYEAERAAETRLAEQIMESFTPAEQFEFLAKPARTDSFLVHPMGELYLGLSGNQQREMHKQFKIRKSLEEARLRSPEQLNTADQIQGAIQAGKREILLRVPAPGVEETKARMQLLAVLNNEQLLKLLRLKRSIQPDQQFSDWIESLQSKDREIAEEVFSKHSQ